MKLILDRIEKCENGKRIAVFEMGDAFVSVDENSMPDGLMDKLFDGVIIEAEYVDCKILSAELLLEETEQKKQEMKNRLRALFNRNKK